MVPDYTNAAIAAGKEWAGTALATVTMTRGAATIATAGATTTMVATVSVPAIAGIDGEPHVRTINHAVNDEAASIGGLRQ